MAGAPRQAHTLNERGARRTRLAGAAVDRELVLKSAAQPRPADVVADGRTAPLDRPRQHRLDRFPQTISLVGFEALAGAGRVQLRAEARFVGVDVPDASDHALVEQDALERPLRAGHRRAEL